MLTIIDVGRFACDYCETKNLKNAVEVQGMGFATRGKMFPPDPVTNKGTIKIVFYAWRERLVLCHEHLGTLLAELREDGILYNAYKRAAEDPNYINTTLEQAQALGLVH